MFSVVFSAVLVLAASAPAGLPKGSVVQAPPAKKSTLLASASISKKEREGIVQFGPKGCVSTWLNAQGRCMIKTNCTEKDIDDYNFKFICVDESGEHVRHVFGKGSFDTEESFDTLVTCSGCTADADDMLVSAHQRQVNSTVAPMSTNALLREIAQDVKELKVEMVNASRNVERLNDAVFKPERNGPVAAIPAPSSLVHREAARLKGLVSKQPRLAQPALRARVTRVKAIKEHAKSHIHKIRRRRAEDDTADDMEDEDAQYQDNNVHRRDDADQERDDDAHESYDDAQERDDNVAERDDNVAERDDNVAERDDDVRADGDSQDANNMQDEEDDQSRDGPDGSRSGEDARNQDDAQEQADDNADAA